MYYELEMLIRVRGNTESEVSDCFEAVTDCENVFVPMQRLDYKQMEGEFTSRPAANRLKAEKASRRKVAERLRAALPKDQADDILWGPKPDPAVIRTVTLPKATLKEVCVIE